MRFVQPVGIFLLIVTVLAVVSWGAPPCRLGHSILVDSPEADVPPPSLFRPASNERIESQPPDQSRHAGSSETAPSAERIVQASFQRRGRTRFFSDWQLLPEGLLYHSYAAGEKEPRFAAQWLWERERGLVWETALGGRLGIVRKGTVGPVNPQGFQLDIEGAAMTRVDPEQDSDLEAADFRIGLVGTWRDGPWRYKAGYSHLSSHVGDEFLIRNPGFARRNYVRDSIVTAVMYDVTSDLQVYGELAGAWNANGGAEPWEVQFGAQYLPAARSDWRGAPFAAINGHWRQEFGARASINAVAGWMWRGGDDHTYRIGVQHYSGPALQYSFFDQYESLTGLSMWMDF